MGITVDGSAAWTAVRDNGSSGTLRLYRLGADQDAAVQVLAQTSGLGNLGTVTAGAVARVGTSDYFYFGSFSRNSGSFQQQVRLELFAFNITTNTWVGQVGRVLIGTTSNAVGIGAGGDIAFDAQGRMVILWSNTSSGTSSRLYRLDTVPTTAGTAGLGTTELTTDIATTSSQPWNGLAYDGSGNLWVSRANTTANPRTSTFAIVNPATGALSSTTAMQGFAVNDLASCGNTPPKLTVQKNLPIGRFASADQFTLDIRQSGSSTNLITATTTGSAIGIQSPSAGPVDVSVGTVYTIAETGAAGANLANYTLTYGCVWDDGDVFVADNTLLPLAAGRAQATLPTIPSGRNAQALTCIITNAAKAVSLTLQKSLTNARFAATDQFSLDIRQSGGNANLAQATTTTSATTGVQTPSANYNVTAGAIYTIAETGTNGANLSTYTFSYGCTWGDGQVFVAAGSALSYSINTGRAQATLPAVPTGRDGQSLTCTIVNTAKNPADVPPRLELQKNIVGRTAGHQFHLSINRTFDNAVVAENTTTGTTTGLQSGTVARGPGEQGVTYTISEGAAGTATNLNGYAASFVCSWSGGGELARGVLSVGANGRLQAMLPAIPAGKNGQALTCTITNQLTPASGLDCLPGVSYVAVSNGDVYRVTASGMNSTRAFGGSSTAANALAINMDGSAAFVGGLSGSTVSINRWVPGSATATSIGSTVRQSNAASVDVPAMVAGAIDPTSGIYYFGGYTAGSPATLRLYAYDPNAASVSGSRPYWQALSVQVPGSTTTQTNNGDLAFDAQGNLYVVWSPGGTGASNNTSVLARINSDLVPRTMPATASTLTSTGTSPQVTSIATLQGASATPFNGVTFDGTGHLYVSYAASGGAGSFKRINPSTGNEVVGSVVTPSPSTNLVDMASCGLPPTMRLQKDIDGRAATNDQFKLEIFADGRTTAVQAATTGTPLTTGIQPQVAGSMVVTVGNYYTIRETGATSSGTTNADLNKYIASYSCQWSDETTPRYSGVLSTSSATNAREARIGPIPAAADLGTAKGKAGQQLVCTITNTPVFDATVTATKTVLGPDGQNTLTGGGWAITATRLATSTSGTTISDPATKSTIASGAIPTPWTLGIPTSSAFVDLRLAETQQAGHDLVPGTGSGSTLAGSYCTITPPIGQSRTILISSTSVDITGVKAGERVECAFVNKQRAGSVAWQKVDGASPTTYLSGSTWTLTGPGVPANTIVVDCVAAAEALCATGSYTDRDPRAGRFRVTGLLHGAHSLTEATAPFGFVRDETPHDFVITPAALDYVFDSAFENDRVEMPAIPLTGGTPGDAFLFGGAALLALAGLGGWLHRRRRSRDTPV